MPQQAYVALLRAINVGGKNKLAMADLVSVFESAGCERVSTYIQSGNVVFHASEVTIASLAERSAAEISRRFGLSVPVIVRSRTELANVAASNPFLDTPAPLESLHVVFLADAPASDRLARLDPNRSPPDVLATARQELYLSCPDGLARTRFTNAYFDRQLATTSTVRNWRTVMKLLELAGS